MPQQERPDELRARDVVEAWLGVEFTFTDLGGGVDYTAADGQTVLEVTRYTNPLVRRDMAVARGQDHVLQLGTGYDWWVTFDGYPRYDGLASRLYEPLLQLEIHGLEQYDHSRMGWWLEGAPGLRGPARVLRNERVLHAQARVGAERPTRLFVMSSGGWAYGGPDAALGLLEQFVASDLVHLRKLGDTRAPSRHLWLWTDFGTAGDFRRAFDPEEGRLPTRAPVLPDAVTDLWCVDEVHGRGWLWSASTSWAWVSAADTNAAGD
jgi:hypothetical protein